jgi:LytS/YehU family sensor histidine kinase
VLVTGVRWLSWIPITPLIFAMARRAPLERKTLLRAILLHLLVALVIAVIYEISWLVFSRWLELQFNPRSGRLPSFGVMVVPTLFSRLLSDLFIYAAVLGLASALASQHRLRERELMSAELEAQLALAQVHALKMQVHPHFLFNTLHAVNVLIHEDPAAAMQMVSQLGDLLRRTLSRATTAEVPFSTELEILQLYLDIERRRFRDRLEVEYDVQPQTLAALVPDLVLQPLVENAIKHGVSRVAGPARIRVLAKSTEDTLVLEIADNGEGLPEPDKVGEGIGLATTRARLERLYGNAHRLTLSRAPGSGCIARVELPFRAASDPLPHAAR